MKAAREFVSEMAEHISMPAVYDDIRKLLLNPDSTIEDFVAVVEHDSMLTVRVMRMVKSQYFGFPRSCENLYQAISLIGLVQLHDLILGSLCMRTFSAVPEQVLNLKAFWRYCVQSGIAAKTIGQYGNTEGHHVFFTLGLLHEVGHAAMFLKESEQSLEALETSREQDRKLDDVEREQLGFDYGQLGAEMMQLWHLPPVYQQVAAHHLKPELAEEQFKPAVEVINLAHIICQNPVVGEHRQLIVESIDQKTVFRHLPPDIDAIIVDEIEANTDSVLELLWPMGAQDLGSQQDQSQHA